jgi:hypothetical protein
MRCAARQGKSVISNGDLTFALDRILMGAERKSLVMSDKVKVLTPEPCRMRRMHRLTNTCRDVPCRAVPCRASAVPCRASAVLHWPTQ